MPTMAAVLLYSVSQLLPHVSPQRCLADQLAFCTEFYFPDIDSPGLLQRYAIHHHAITLRVMQPVDFHERLEISVFSAIHLIMP
ncbi:Uncharacterised protein [Cedecea neteri]|uniref:Uncharacterized protein n=1 Tax=Cedecea neteri TaxID=158822 RepID=A0A2X3L024_9ENTR|nr:Uncharacterised protein [Cedecea neteri]